MPFISSATCTPRARNARIRARAKGLWFEHSESIIKKNFGPMIAQGADRLVLEDMHPANVFIDVVTGKAICIDCIVKFVNPFSQGV